MFAKTLSKKPLRGLLTAAGAAIAVLSISPVVNHNVAEAAATTAIRSSGSDSHAPQTYDALMAHMRTKTNAFIEDYKSFYCTDSASFVENINSSKKKKEKLQDLPQYSFPPNCYVHSGDGQVIHRDSPPALDKIGRRQPEAFMCEAIAVKTDRTLITKFTLFQKKVEEGELVGRSALAHAIALGARLKHNRRGACSSFAFEGVYDLLKDEDESPRIEIISIGAGQTGTHVFVVVGRQGDMIRAGEPYPNPNRGEKSTCFVLDPWLASLQWPGVEDCSTFPKDENGAWWDNAILVFAKEQTENACGRVTVVNKLMTAGPMVIPVLKQSVEFEDDNCNLALEDDL